jgi:NADH-quinone oxidoreductase subunit C
MNFEEITQAIQNKFSPESVITKQASGLMPYIVIKPALISQVCSFLYENPGTYFDYLACMTGIDNGPEAATMEIAYNLYSIPFELKYCIKVSLKRNTEGEKLPEIDTVSHIWRTANWHEREIYDLLGIHFNGHLDLRRILLPADWEGYPLRKDNKTQEYYHDIKVAY